MTPRLIALLLALALPASASASDPDPGVVFQWEAPVDAGRSGLARLPLPEDVLTRCAADLSDLRLYDATGQEIPYAVDDGPQLTAIREHHVAIDDLARHREPDAPRWAPWVYLETFTIQAPVDGAEHRWTMTLESTTRSFVREVEVRAGGPGEGGELLAKGSIFRLEDRGRRRLTLQLPPLPKGTISVQLRGGEDGYIEPRVTLTSSWQLGAPERVAIPLAIVDRTQATGTTSLVLERPAAIVPRSLRFVTDRGTFERGVEVWDEGPGRQDGRLGRGTVWRLDEERAVQELDVPIAPAVGERLRIEIRDGDSPPLGVSQVLALLTQPTLVFDAPTDGAVTMRFGAERVRRPEYDIVGLLGAGKWLQGEADSPSLFDPRALHAASLGAIVPSPTFSREPALAFAARAGKAVDVSLWSHLRPVDVPASDDHLVLVRLDPPELGKARPDLGDVRIVDAQGRQWPYLLDTAKPGSSAVALTPGLRETGRDGRTRYPLELTSGPAQLVRLDVQADAGFFDRAYELLDGDGRRIAAGRLVREAGDPRPISIPLGAPRADRLVLVVSDGDDAPLALTGFVAHVRTTDLVAALAPGRYDLLVGNPESAPAAYELARVRSTVFTVEPLVVHPGPLQPNPRKKQVDLRGSGAEKALMWAAILGAVLLLGWITLKSAGEPPQG
jgi:hypothetical protein